jgi:ABC-type amino acid transport substrate-binding protein
MNSWCLAVNVMSVATLFSVGLAQESQAQEACKPYTVKAGDTLGNISLAAFGKVDYQMLFNANVAVLRDNPSSPPEGTVLQIPCADGSIPGGASFAQEAAPEEAAEIAVAAPKVANRVAEAKAAGAYVRPPRFFTGDQWPPFSDSTLPSQGMFVSVALAAFERGDPDMRYSMNWVDDWDAHIRVLLPNGGLDLAIGFYEPNCDSLELASEDTIEICETFVFSEPIYDSVFGIFALSDSLFAQAKTFADLKGARVCRPEGNWFHDLEAQGLAEPDISIFMPVEEWECLYGLLEGAYDVASFEEQYFATALADAGATDEIVENPRLTTIQSAAVMAYKGNESAVEHISSINRGLAELRATGEWAKLVTESLQEAASMAEEP